MGMDGGAQIHHLAGTAYGMLPQPSASRRFKMISLPAISCLIHKAVPYPVHYLKILIVTCDPPRCRRLQPIVAEKTNPIMFQRCASAFIETSLVTDPSVSVKPILVVYEDNRHAAPMGVEARSKAESNAFMLGQTDIPAIPSACLIRILGGYLRFSGGVHFPPRILSRHTHTRPTPSWTT
jgi:hypothetical protein